MQRITVCLLLVRKRFYSGNIYLHVRAFYRLCGLQERFDLTSLLNELFPLFLSLKP